MPLLLLLLPILAWGAPAQVSAQADPPSSTRAGMDAPADADSVATLEGVVTKHGTLGPLADAEVLLAPVDDAVVYRRLTGGQGRFAFGALPPGVYELRVRHLAFREVRRELLVEAGAPVQVEVAMALEVLALEPVVVVSRRVPALESVGFHDRRLRGVGHFFTAEELSRRGVRRTTDLFRSVPGFRVHAVMGGARHQLTGRGGCEPTLYVNGGRAVTSRDIDELLDVRDLVGIEAYPGALAPPGYSGTPCGMILAWVGTDTDVEGAEDGPGWAQALAFVAVSIWMALQIS